MKLSEILAENGIVCEFSDEDYLVMMLSPYMTDGETEKLYSALSSVPKKAKLEKNALPYTLPKTKLTPREAILSLSESVPVEESVGRTLAGVTVGCPPAVPIIVSGEVIDENTVEAAKYYGIKSFSVIILFRESG